MRSRRVKSLAFKQLALPAPIFIDFLFLYYYHVIVKNNKTKQRGDIVKGLSMMSQIAFLIIASVSIGVFIGYMLDQWLGTSWLLPVFSLLGVGASFKALYDYVKKL
jgi:F0F1-type ATP synthase assembly protein I